MASNKDILNAQRFNRRRLVTAFISGTPGGRELESKSFVPPLIGGIVISLLMLGIAFAMGKFSPTLPDNWQNNTLIIVKGTGARYYSVQGVLHPIYNVTSARMRTPAGSLQTVSVGEKVIAGIPRGDAIGEPEAPDNVPAPADLKATEWNACVMENASTHTWVSIRPDGLEPVTTTLVKQGDTLYVIAENVRHRIEPEHLEVLKNTLNINDSPVFDVPADWLNLFNNGTPFTPISLDNSGTPVSGMPSSVHDAVVGTIINVKFPEGDHHYLVIGDGQLVQLSDVSYAMYQASSTGNPYTIDPPTVSVGEIANIHVVTEGGPVPSDWPDTLGTITNEQARPCAHLDVSDIEKGSVLSAIPADSPDLASAQSGMGTSASPAASNSPHPPAVGSTSVLGGSGVLARSTSGGSLGAVMLISDTGLSHGLGLNYSEAMQRLGYDENSITPIPGPWIALIPEGIDLKPIDPATGSAS